MTMFQYCNENFYKLLAHIHDPLPRLSVCLLVTVTVTEFRTVPCPLETTLFTDGMYIKKKEKQGMWTEQYVCRCVTKCYDIHWLSPRGLKSALFLLKLKN